MIEIKRSELIKSFGDFIGFVSAPDFSLNELDDIEELNKMEFIQTIKEKNYPDFIRSNLFDIDTDQFMKKIGNDVCSLKFEAIKHFNEGGNLEITPYETCRDGMFDDDKDIKIHVLEYHEIKKYYELFSKLYNQDIYKEHRLEEKQQKKR